jgi:hypothetical protein
MSDQTINPSDPKALEQRIADLEKNVKEIGNVVYEMIEELRGQGQEGPLAAFPEPTCPPFCARDQ